MLSLFILASNPFSNFASGLGAFLSYLLGIVAMFTLAMTFYYMIQGEKEMLRKFFKWSVVVIIGFILIRILS